MSTLKRRPDRKGGTYYVYYYDENGKFRGKSLGVTSEKEAWVKQRAFDADIKTARAAKQDEASEEKRQLRIINRLIEGRGRSDFAKGAQWQEEQITDPVTVLNRAIDSIDRRQLEKLQAEENERRERDLLVDDFWKKYSEWALDGNRSRFTWAGYQTAWRKLIKHMKPLLINDVTPEMIAGLKNKLREDGLSEEGVVQYLISLQGVFSTAIKMGHYMKANPINIKRHFKAHSSDRRFLTNEECKKVLDAAKKTGERNTYLLIAIALHTGMRKTEITNLRWEDFDFGRKNPETGKPEPVVNVTNKREDTTLGITEFTTKSKDRRTIPVKKALVKILKPYRKPEGYVILPIIGTHVRRTNYEMPRQFNEVRKDSGVEFTLHMLRHTFASHAAMAGVSIFKISKWLGHSTVEITAAVYAHLQAHDEDIDRF